MEDFVYKKIDRSNARDLISIYKSSFNKPITEDYLIKKNNTSTFGLSFCGFIAYYTVNNEPAAYYGVYPCLIEYNGDKILCAQSGDTMTSPKYQGKGLFVKLASLTYEYAMQNGVRFVFGFPNENSYPGFVKKLNWQHFEDMHAYLVRVRCVTFIRLKKIFRFPERWFYLYAYFILKKRKKGKVPFESTIISSGFAGVPRDEKFRGYKTYEENFIVRICGRSVWLKPNIDALLIGDIEMCTEKEFVKIIKKLKRLAFIMGVPYLRYHCSPGVYFERMFVPISNKLESSYPVGWVDFNSGLDLQKLKFTMCDNDTF